MSILAIIIIIKVLSNTTPILQDNVDELNDSNQCINYGCVYNATLSSSAPCRNNATSDSVVCADGQHTIPLSSSFGLLILIVVIAFIIIVIKKAKDISPQ